VVVNMADDTKKLVQILRSPRITEDEAATLLDSLVETALSEGVKEGIRMAREVVDATFTKATVQ
jgi:F0F1-type ATP synthase delta subunit